MLNTAYFTVDNGVIIECLDVNFFQTVLINLGKSETIEEFHQRMTESKTFVPYNVYEVSNMYSVESREDIQQNY